MKTKSLFLSMLFPAMLLAQNAYVSPAGSSGNAGTKVSPWDVLTGRACSARDNDTTIVFLDGIYEQDSTGTWNNWTFGYGAAKHKRIIADSGAMPVLVRKNGSVANITLAANTTLQGMWIGGLPLQDSLIGGSSRSFGNGDSLVQCVIFNTWDDGWGSDRYKLVIKNCLFINCGYRPPQQFHSLYLTGAGTPDSTIVAYRNVFLTSDSRRTHWVNDRSLPYASLGYSIHCWHNPHSTRIKKNFSNYRGVQHGHDTEIRDNVFWSGNFSMREMEDISHDSTAIDTPHVWRKNILVKNSGAGDPKEMFTWPYSYSYFGSASYPETMWWDGDSTWLETTEFSEIAPGYVKSNGVTKRPILFTKDTVSVLLGSTEGAVDSAIDGITNSTYNSSAQTVYNNKDIILANWQKLLDVVDFWEGTTEESVYDLGDLPDVPTVSTDSAESIGFTTATLYGTVNPNGGTTSYQFQYGTTTSYGSTTTQASAGDGSADSSVSAALSGLAEGTTYHYRITATNPGGTADGADSTFLTAGITITGTLSAFSAAKNAYSAGQSYLLSATGLSANVIITPPSGFQVSSDSTTWQAADTVNHSGGTITSTKVYIRYAPTAWGSASGNITHTSTGATTQNVYVYGVTPGARRGFKHN